MKRAVVKTVRRLARNFGFDISKKGEYPPDFSEEDIEIIKAVSPYTRTSPERIYAVIQAIRYVVSCNIPGDIVECGVWRGGSMMAAAKTLLLLNQSDRHLYLYDTYEGMSEPTNDDIDYEGKRASVELAKDNKDFSEDSTWCYASVADVQKAMEQTGYDASTIHLVKGKVEETIPANTPESIAILRLDTDWYESTLHEMLHLYPRLVKGGVLLLDDYGHWVGAKKAVDQYIKENNLKLLLSRTDYTGRLAVKQ
ncbi:MAG: macrocin O-methyltransferase [Chitinivibrionales bacterium]|nr:macrocin O-methyltransferase [Chitinivibrionales bacterium]